MKEITNTSVVSLICGPIINDESYDYDHYSVFTSEIKNLFLPLHEL